MNKFFVIQSTILSPKNPYQYPFQCWKLAKLGNITCPATNNELQYAQYRKFINFPCIIVTIYQTAEDMVTGVNVRFYRCMDSQTACHVKQSKFLDFL
jgi:hypothetical protein